MIDKQSIEEKVRGIERRQRQSQIQKALRNIIMRHSSRGYLMVLMVSLFILTGCAQLPVETPSAPIVGKEIKRIVTVKAQGVILHYQGESFWSEDEWSTLVENRDQSSFDLTQNFINDVSRYGEGGEYVVNTVIEFNEDMKSTVLRCDIEGAGRKSGNSYWATFRWLLGPLGLDFIDNDFEESGEGLFWEGLVNGIPITVTVELPVIDGAIYEAWAHPNGHCHAHIWWEFSPQVTKKHYERGAK